MKLKKILTISAVLALLAGGYVYFFVWNKAHPDFAELEADFKLPAEQIYHEFVDNAEGASKKYTGKMIQLSGTVNSMEKVDSLSIAVFVFNEGMFGDEGVRCTFLNADISGVNSTDELKGYDIKGFCSGFNETDVILEKCTLVKNK